MLRTCWIWLMMAAPALAGGQAIAADVADPFQEAKAVLAELDAFWQTIDSARTTATMSNAGSVRGKDFEGAQSFVLAFERPGKFIAGPPNLGMLPSAVSDGESLYVYYPYLDGYVQSPAPDRLTPSVVKQAIGSSVMGSSPMLAAFLSETPSTILLEDVVDGKVLGDSTIDGVECRTIRLSKPPIDIVLHLKAGEAPWPRRIELDFSAVMANAMDVVPRDLDMGAAVDFEPWATGEDVGLRFRFVEPRDAYAADSFYELVARAQEPHPLVNQKAPADELDSLDGAPVDLGAVIGKKAVLIDFWATYCPPCVTTLPFYAEMKREFGDGLAVYAINLGQDRETIREFLKEQDIEITVLLDPNAEFARQYKIESIPQCFLIDTAGNIQAAHAGYADGYEGFLKEQVIVLVRGGAL